KLRGGSSVYPQEISVFVKFKLQTIGYGNFLPAVFQFPITDKIVGVVGLHIGEYLFGHYTIWQLAGSLYTKDFPFFIKIKVEPFAEVNIIRGFQVVTLF